MNVWTQRRAQHPLLFLIIGALLLLCFVSAEADTIGAERLSVGIRSASGWDAVGSLTKAEAEEGVRSDEQVTHDSQPEPLALSQPNRAAAYMATAAATAFQTASSALGFAHDRAAPLLLRAKKAASDVGTLAGARLSVGSSAASGALEAGEPPRAVRSHRFTAMLLRRVPTVLRGEQSSGTAQRRDAVAGGGAGRARVVGESSAHPRDGVGTFPSLLVALAGMALLAASFVAVRRIGAAGFAHDLDGDDDVREEEMLVFEAAGRHVANCCFAVGEGDCNNDINDCDEKRDHLEDRFDVDTSAATGSSDLRPDAHLSSPVPPPNETMSERDEDDSSSVSRPGQRSFDLEEGYPDERQEARPCCPSNLSQLLVMYGAATTTPPVSTNAATTVSLSPIKAPTLVSVLVQKEAEGLMKASAPRDIAEPSDAIRTHHHSRDVRPPRNNPNDGDEDRLADNRVGSSRAVIKTMDLTPSCRHNARPFVRKRQEPRLDRSGRGIVITCLVIMSALAAFVFLRPSIVGWTDAANNTENMQSEEL